MPSTLVMLILAALPVDEVRAHADAILSCQLPDGAIVSASTGDEIAIVPYWGNQAALGLFEAYRVTDDKAYLDGAIAWTDWYLKHMTPDGRIAEYRGARDDYQPVGEMRDDVSAAASFLECANTRRILTHDRYFLLREQAKLWSAHERLMAGLDYDGLAVAGSETPVKPTLLSAEAYDGLYHSRQIARSLREHAWNTEIYYARRKIDKSFERMQADGGLYPAEKAQAAEVANGGSQAFNGVGLASLAAIAKGPLSEREAKETLRQVRQLYPELDSCSTAQLYWWVLAATRAEDKSLAAGALKRMEERVAAANGPVDHAYCIRAITLVNEGEPRRFGVPMGSTYIPYQRPIFR